jgi:hypothetical protein
LECCIAWRGNTKCLFTWTSKYARASLIRKKDKYCHISIYILPFSLILMAIIYFIMIRTSITKLISLII